MVIEIAEEHRKNLRTEIIKENKKIKISSDGQSGIKTEKCWLII